MIKKSEARFFAARLLLFIPIFSSVSDEGGVRANKEQEEEKGTVEPVSFFPQFEIHRFAAP